MRVDALLAAGAARWPSKTALICGRERWSFAQLDDAASALAATLYELGLRPDQRVVVALPNSVEAVVAIFAVMRAGAVAVPVNPLMRPARLAQIVADSEPWGVLRESGDDIGTWDIRQLLAHRATATLPFIDRRNDDLAALIYTSGTTGAPKGVMLSHGNMTSAAAAIVKYLGNTAEDVILNVLPLAFTYGLGQVTTAFLSGATLVLERSFQYPQAVLQVMQRERVTGFALVPTIATMLLQHGIGAAQLPHLRYITNAAAALPAARVTQLREALPHTQLFLMYGQTECQRAAYLPPDQIDCRPGSVGVAIPGSRVDIVDDEGKPVRARVVGELVVTGPHVMRGYWNRPVETSAILSVDPATGDHTLRTGDLFWRDEDSFLYFVDRRDDIVKTRGEKVAPRQVEEVIAALPGVSEVAVYGVEDELLGQAIAASVTVAADVHLTPADIKRHCRTHLEDYMVPKYVEITAALPTTLSGKVSRRELQAAALAIEENAA